MSDRIRRLRLREQLPARLGGRPPAPAPTTPVRRRRVSRREREARQRRRLYWFMGIAGTLLVLVFAVSLTNEYWIKPRRVLATVEGTKIRRQDYWKVRSVDLINQASQYQQFASFFGGDQQQQQQYLDLAAQARADLQTVWGSTSIDETTLTKMIDDQVYLKRIDREGLAVTDQDVANYIAQQFEPSDAPLITPTPSPTLIPARAAWATETAIAQLTGTPAGSPVASPEASPGMASPGALPASATPDASPAVASSPMGDTPMTTMAAPASPAANPAASPAASPTASPAASPAVSPTPNPEQARATAAAGYADFREAVFDTAHLSEESYEQWVVRPAVARQKLKDKLEAQVGQSAEQVHAAHILVDTSDLAQQIYNQVTQPNADFAQAAIDQSTDESTAVNGGDLGWFVRGEMVKPFEDLAFSLQPGEIGQPVQTEFGWHVIKVFAHEPDRPLTDDQITKLKTQVVEQWLAAQKADMRISSEVDPTPTPETQTFEPPAAAPPTPTLEPTPEPTPVPEGSPVVDPAASPAG